MFTREMSIGEAMELHPEAPLVFASFHLGGCRSCSVNEQETIEQVCQGYGIEEEILLDTLNGLFEESHEEVEA